MIPTIEWADDSIRLIDQTLLPETEEYLDITELDDLCEAIASLRVRGAPALGIAGAYGVSLIARAARTEADPLACVQKGAERLRGVRPTAVNLAWAVNRMMVEYERSAAEDPDGAAEAVLRKARALHENDLAASRAMGDFGAELLSKDARILTHCNTGGLATGGLGTALAVPFAAARQDKNPEVFVAETRPLLQGARLTAWELVRENIKATVLVDGARAWLMETGRVDIVLVGADRIAANGDTANKIGTLSAAVAAARYDIPFYIVAPASTFDLSLPTGVQIPVEQRAPEEVMYMGDKQLAPEGCQIWNPAFDVTPAELIAGWVTEYGIVEPPFTKLSSKR